MVKHENPEKFNAFVAALMILQYLPAVLGCVLCVLVGLYVGIPYRAGNKPEMSHHAAASPNAFNFSRLVRKSGVFSVYIH
jgi:hypothetical protein